MKAFALNTVFKMKSINWFLFFIFNKMLRGFLVVFVAMGISQGWFGRNPKPHLAVLYCNSEQRFY